MKTRALQLRRVTHADHDLLRELIVAFHHEDGHPIPADALGRTLVAVAAGEPSLKVWLLVRGEQVAGYAALTLGWSIEVGGVDAYLDDLFVLPAERGQGIGRNALTLVEAEATKLGVRRLCLEVERHNHRAHAFYTQRGYADHGRHLLSKRL